MATLFFSTVQSQLSYWLSHIAKTFAGGYSGSGENGVDISMPLDTPVYAVAGGQVVGAGYYGGGGVVSVRETPGKVWYYQHLDQNAPGVTPGTSVQAGQLIGYSGGQNVGGNHPSTPEFSSFQHIEVGINAPWGGIWGGGEGPNVDPRPYLRALPASDLNASTGYNTLSLNPPGQPPIVPPGGIVVPPGIDINNPLTGILEFFLTLPGKIGHQFLRIVKVASGLALILLGLVLAFLPEAGAGVATAAGVPEFAGAIRQGTRGGPSGAVRGGIRGASLLPGRQRAATREALRQRQATARAFGIEQQRAARRVERSNATTANLAYPRRGVPTNTPARNAPVRQGTAGAFGFGRNAPARKGPLLGPGGFGNYNAPAKKRSPEEGLNLLRDIARERNAPGELTETSEAKSARRANSMQAKRQTKARKTRLAQPPRQMPSQQNLAQRAGVAKRKVAQAVYRRRTGRPG